MVILGSFIRAHPHSLSLEPAWLSWLTLACLRQLPHAVHAVRVLGLQGSDNLDHWKVNLTFDPVAFEDEALGVKVRWLLITGRVLVSRLFELVLFCSPHVGAP